MKWFLAGIAIIVGILLCIFLIGAVLPVQHVATRSAIFRQPPEAIWQAITNYQDFPSWRSTVKRVEPLPSTSGLFAWREIDSHGNSLPMEAIQAQPSKRLVTRIAGAKLPFGGTWTYEITPVTGGTQLRITENGEVYNPFFRFVSRFIIGEHATMDTYLRALGAKFGEPTVLQG
jgi:uncharacterized protein YndB with AHSA1/START domain